MKKLDFDTKKWPFIAKISGLFPDSEIFLVGGSVRDSLLGKKVKDFDFVVRNVPVNDLLKVLKKSGKVDLVGKRFGVLKFRPKNSKEQFDIALPRTEFSLSFTGGYRDFEVQSDHTLPIEKDLSRRDFTINAMAYNLLTGELIDPFLGLKDLEEKIIRTVGSATIRFQEDYSRILRAVRFACQLDFSISDKTKNALQKLALHLNDKTDSEWIVSREILSQEFLKAFDSSPIKCLELCDDLNILQTILPEIKELQSCDQSPPYHNEGNVYQHTILALEASDSPQYKKYFAEPIPLLSKLGILFHDIGKPRAKTVDDDGRIRFTGHAEEGAKITGKICRRLKLGASPYYSFHCDDLVWIVREHLYSIETKEAGPRPSEIEAMFFSQKHPSQSLLHTILADQIATVPDKGIKSTEPFEILMERITEIAERGELPEPLITGEDVMKWTKSKPGPGIKTHLENVRDAQLSGKISTKAQAKKIVLGQKL